MMCAGRNQRPDETESEGVSREVGYLSTVPEETPSHAGSVTALKLDEPECTAPVSTGIRRGQRRGERNASRDA